VDFSWVGWAMPTISLHVSRHKIPQSKMAVKANFLPRLTTHQLTTQTISQQKPHQAVAFLERLPYPDTIQNV
jgi:hypothetical protein